MSDPHVQREAERAFDEEEYARFVQRQRQDRLLDYTPIDPCRDCGEWSVEVERGRWECGCRRAA